MTASQPRSLSSAARSGDETTPIVFRRHSNVLHAVTADTRLRPRSAPNHLASSSAVVAHQHAVTRRIAEPVDCSSSSQVGGLWHQLIGFDHRDIGEATKLGLESPDALVGCEHRVIVRRGVLIVDVVAVDGHSVSGFQLRTAEPTRDDSGGVRTNDEARRAYVGMPTQIRKRDGRESRMWEAAQKWMSTPC